MINLAPASTTTVQYLSGTTVVDSVLTDTLYVQNVDIDFSNGSMSALIARGTFANGVFGQNYPAVRVVVNPDGSFLSDDGKWKGNLGSTATNLIAQLRATFDQFVLAAGLVQGTIA